LLEKEEEFMYTMRAFSCARVVTAILIFVTLFLACADKEKIDTTPCDTLIVQHYKEYIGEPRVEKISEHVWVAISYDTAHTALIHTGSGYVIVDTAMNPKRGMNAKKALLAKVPRAPLRAIIYTHSHIDHCGGTTSFIEKGVPIWATDKFADHFVKQYQLFVPIESLRARRQFAAHLSLEDIPSTGIGARLDMHTPFEEGGLGMIYPTHTFSGKKMLTIDGLDIEMIEAPGESHDHLIVWIPADKTLIAGDNFYWAFPNLYTLRGTSPRKVSHWFNSVDIMRRKEAEHLVPMHTKPIHGKKEIAEALTNYRDAIQWIRDEVVRGANRGEDIDTLAERIHLPEHLAKHHYNKEFRGQIDWCVRSIYTNNLGWYDGRPDKLYTHPVKEIAKREVELLGGTDRIMELADEAFKKGDERWAIHLLVKLQDSGIESDDLKEKLAQCYESLGRKTCNFDGRSYLMESAYELREGMPEVKQAKINEEMALGMPLEQMFNVMATRLNPEKAMDVHESVFFVFPDEKKRFIVTIRRGIAEIVAGEPLPGTPKPIATLTVDSKTYRKMALKMISPISAIASGKLKVSGSWIGFLTFFRKFQQ